MLIVGLSADYNQRCAFEFSLMSQLNSNTPIAGASCDFLKAEDPLTRANIQKVVASTKADAVVTTRVIDSQEDFLLDVSPLIAQHLRRDGIIR